MTRNEILDYLIKLQVVEKTSSRYNSILGDYKDDFIQYIYLQILELPDEKLIALFEKNELIYYILAICKNNALGKYSNFMKTHKQKNTVSIEDEDIQCLLQSRTD